LAQTGKQKYSFSIVVKKQRLLEATSWFWRTIFRAPVQILDIFRVVVRVRPLYSGKPYFVKCIFDLVAVKCKNLVLAEIVKSFIISL
jgi:ABC-type bacteriocin/lantibiotic exporter with double-glycine peptidase domain